MNIPAPQAAGGIPQIEDGLYVVKFNDIYLKNHADWAQAKDKFGHADNGDRFHFNATVLDGDRQPVMLADVKEEVEDPTIEFTLEAMTRNMSSHEKSTAHALLKGILTPAEFQLWLNSTPGNEPDFSAVEGRELNAQIGHNGKGYPQIEAFLGQPKKGK